jgi:hypothetical protein
MRMVEKRAAVIDDDVARLRFVRRSVAAHEAASRRRTRFLRRSIAAHRASHRRVRLVFRAVVTAAVLAVVLQSDAPRAVRHRPPPPDHRPRLVAPWRFTPKVWLVEHKRAMDIYSNGLRIENEFLVNTRARAYPVFDRQSRHASGAATQPAGIVFHTTESRMAPFDSSANTRLQRNGRDLMAFIAKKPAVSLRDRSLRPRVPRGGRNRLRQAEFLYRPHEHSKRSGHHDGSEGASQHDQSCRDLGNIPDFPPSSSKPPRMPPMEIIRPPMDAKSGREVMGFRSM